jgi:hypothetical protein
VNCAGLRRECKWKRVADKAQASMSLLLQHLAGFTSDLVHILGYNADDDDDGNADNAMSSCVKVAPPDCDEEMLAVGPDVDAENEEPGGERSDGEECEEENEDRTGDNDPAEDADENEESEEDEDSDEDE